jgi:hypothetical protein
MSGRQIPSVASVITDEQIGFVAALIDDSGVATKLDSLITRPTGRKRTIPLRSLLVALLLLASIDRPLHLKAATRLLFRDLPSTWRQRLGTAAPADTRKSFLARYRCVRYLFHAMLAVIDPSLTEKNAIVSHQVAERSKKSLADAEIAEREMLLADVLERLLDASIGICTASELSSFDGSVGLDATPVPLYSRGPSKSAGTTASDPDGGWYIREGDHRQTTGPNGKRLRKIAWALEATIVTMGRAPGTLPTYPNLLLGICLAKPGVDPGRTGVALLAGVVRRGYPAGFAGADRGYTQTLPEHFALPAKALGYKVVMDYKAADLGVQANSQGALLVDGSFYCPAMPAALVSASADHRAGTIDDKTRSQLIAARVTWRLSRKEGPDRDGYERFACPALGEHPKLCCSLRHESKALGQVPVLRPPDIPPKVCTQSAVTIAPDIGARFRQDLAFGSQEWQDTYAAYRNTIEGLNGFIKDTAHEALANPDRRRVRGIAAQSIFVGLLAMAANIRKIAAHRALVADGEATKVAARAKRRRMSIRDHLPPPPGG